MDDEKRGDDAADHAPRPGKPPEQPQRQPEDTQTDKLTDGGRAIKDEDLSSVNDE